MASRKEAEIGDFFELRHGIERLTEFASAALRFLDQHGIALSQKRTYAPRSESNGTGATGASEGLRAKVKRHYVARRQQAGAATNGSGRVSESAVASMSYADKRRAARARSAALLARLDRTEVRAIEDSADRIYIGALIRRGYAKKKGDGYVLTAKGAKGYAHDEPEPPAATGDELPIHEAAAQLGLSHSYVRALIKRGALEGHLDQRPHRRTRFLIPREAVARLEAARAAQPGAE